jgi:hypothetical protein
MAGFAKQSVSVLLDKKAFHISVPALKPENWVHDWIDVVNVAF